MAKLGSLAKMIKQAQENKVAEQFIEDLTYTIEEEDRGSVRTPTQSFKPSGISGCTRSLYYQLTGVAPDDTDAGVNLVGICESGTDRHERIQNYIAKMSKHDINCEWLDVGEYLKENKVTDPQVISKIGNETKLYSKKYNMRFMCDGLIKYNGEYYIVEIKTESTHKFNRHTDAWADHKLQATCYSMTIGVPKVIFIYEDRDNCTKKGYLVEITELMKNRIESIIDYVNNFVLNKEVPPRELDKCKYCDYQNQCRRDGE